MVASAVVAIAACGVALRWRRRATEADGRLAAVRAALPPGWRSRPVETAVEDLVGRVDAIADRLGIVEQAVGASPIGLMMLDGGLAVTFASAAARAMVEGGATETATMARVRRAAERVLATGEPRDERIELFGRRRRVLRQLVAPLGNGAGPGVTVHLIDITEREHVEAMRRDFVANVSHELKTPLGALSVLAEALADAENDATRHRLATRVRTEAGRMSELVRNLLDLSRVESEDPETKPVDLGDVIDEAARGVAILADASGVTVTTEPPEATLVVAADRRQLVSAVSNLLDNAVTHSIPGTGRPEVVVRGRRDGVHAVIEVEDHGIGIPLDQQDRIFERFYRVDRGRSRHRGGTGLGLAIVRHVAMSHHGTVEVESSPGNGSTFRIRIPLEAS
ncbi:N/A [soil metagenome]